jgi:long-chain acyl-CoA synthetase
MMRIVKGKALTYEKKITLNEMFQETVSKYPDVKAITFFENNDSKNLTYQKFWNYVELLAKGLLSIGIKKGDRIAIYSDTRYEWELFDFAGLMTGAIVVTIHSVLNKKQVEYIIRDSGSRVVVVENEELLKNLTDLDVDIISIEKTDKTGINELLKLGQEFEVNYENVWRSVKPDDVASIVYTSGTTGEPKGTMLTHWNWVFNSLSVMSVTPFYPGEEHVCYLP